MLKASSKEICCLSQAPTQSDPDTASIEHATNQTKTRPTVVTRVTPRFFNIPISQINDGSSHTTRARDTRLGAAFTLEFQENQPPGMISVPPITSLQPRRWPCRDRASGKLPIRRAQSRLSTQCRTNTVNNTNNRCQSQTPRVYTCTKGIKLLVRGNAVGSTRVTSLARSTNDKQQQGTTIRTECPSTSVSHPVRGYNPTDPLQCFSFSGRVLHLVRSGGHTPE